MTTTLAAMTTPTTLDEADTELLDRFGRDGRALLLDSGRGSLRRYLAWRRRGLKPKRAHAATIAYFRNERDTFQRCYDHETGAVAPPWASPY